ncbi:MBL fold metallo-hydrolase [Mucilaginibacter phyllosphaerae]|uniref:MBL fold metallo-hydrolase n=1 Tax=Mucilaginibacter phyllosphaerae TaxID=1812349 RepID=A0A4Y8AJ41_9SPHI|nr:MBL fold metallo-hydrolase [Mucilaginibacter phyllosphaerae]MBB3967906.1 phosphoribosyl 1,2-cyclic phosphate phosphodiesterase [Mucilaginibacter phyllosphaerae]TEW69054.1 MBL fold metallo-hydrolase [Mucilaginibacter phyllosphaerae]GGH02494.1 MBL fold metallo-hydrolase [Mucilaginibacter phyllosphaerae]
MTITFLGTGTSQGVPVIACTCPVCQSADGHDKRLRTSVLVEGGGKVIAIDAGPDFRYQMLREKVMHLDAIAFTHEHKDHVAGMDDIRAFNYKQQGPVDVYADERVQLALRREFPYIFAREGYPGIPQITLHTVGNQPFAIGDVPFIPIEVMHYKLPVKGYRINDFTYITDAKTVAGAEIDKIRGTKILVINALQKEKHISHFTLDEAIAFARETGAQKTYLTHISHRLGKHADISKELPAGIELAYDGLKLQI